jgi:hypothetical protein
VQQALILPGYNPFITIPHTIITDMSIPVSPPPGFEQLSQNEKIDYIQDLWDLTLDSPDLIQSPDWHLEIVRERLASFEVRELRTWDSVKAKLARQISEN